MSNTSIIEVTLSNGSVLPFRQYESKAGNECYGILGSKANGERYFSKYGVNVTQEVTGNLDDVDSLRVLGKTFAVTRSKEAKQDSKGRDIAGSERLVLRSVGKVKVNGKEKEFSLRITPKADSTDSNVGGSINGRRGSGGGPAAVSTL